MMDFVISSYFRSFHIEVLKMKLFAAGEAVASHMSFENFRDYHQTATVISMESMSGFLGQVKDIFHNTAKVFSTQKEEHFIEDTLKNRFQTIAKANTLQLGDLKTELVSKPESFKGYYTDYLKDLNAVSVATVELVNEVIPYLKTAIAGFINEYSDDKVDNIYGYVKFKAAEKKAKELVKVIGDYFPLPANKVRAYPHELLKSTSDIRPLYELLSNLSKDSINPETFKKLEHDSNGISELVDTLIQHNIATGVLLKNNDAKKELIECITILAHLTEFYASLYARTVTYCSSFKSLTDLINAKD